MQHVCIQEEDFSVDAVYQAMLEALGASVGAVVSFVGLVRDRNPHTGDASGVSTLSLEHYPGMTEKSIEAILNEAHERWPLLASHVTHRVGSMSPSEQIVLVMVASAHRDAAFAAAEFVMDYLKTDAVFWKRETTAEGEHWVQSTSDDQQRAEKWRVGGG
jgi:molybdopterin synthase catalytic subunit